MLYTCKAALHIIPVPHYRTELNAPLLPTAAHMLLVVYCYSLSQNIRSNKSTIYCTLFSPGDHPIT